MNILPKKSWHVRTKRNIERVRRDEAKAAEEERKLEDRIKQAEQEARVDLLRKRVTSSSADGDGSVNETIRGLCDGRVDIFADHEKRKDAKNVEAEKEKKEEQESYEKKIGLLTYLGQTQLEESRPWYLEAPEKRKKYFQKPSEEDRTPSKQEDNEKKQNAKKSFYDPLIDMTRYLDQMKRNKGEKPGQSFGSSSKLPSSEPQEPKKREELDYLNMSHRHRSKKKKKKEKKKKKHKRHKKHVSTSSDSSSSSDQEEGEIPQTSVTTASQSTKTIDQLRAERLRREAKERERVARLLNPKLIATDEVVTDDRKRSYNSQFNPHLARNKNLETQ